eukprot:4196925-Prymnesium_polylepis.1
MSPASRGAHVRRWTVRRERLGGCLSSARAGQRPREVTSQRDAFDTMYTNYSRNPHRSVCPCTVSHLLAPTLS